jgi:redox-sensing transcriptional repressor
MASQGRTFIAVQPHYHTGHPPVRGALSLALAGRFEEHMTAQRDQLNAVSDTADQRAVAATDQRAVPEATVARLAIYLRALTGLGERGTATVSSESLATAAGVNSAKLRKDLSHLGSYGVRGVGYDVALLTEQIQRTLGLHQDRAVALIGIGHLGQALAGYAGFASRGFRISAVVDSDPAIVGTRLRGMTVQHVDCLAEVVRSENIAIAVMAVPAAAAQDVCDRLVSAGVTSILNFAPTVLSVPAHVDVRKVDLAAELQILSFHDNRKAARSDFAVAAAGSDGFAVLRSGAVEVRR